MLGDGLRMTAMGLLAGLAAAVLLGRALSGRFYGVPAMDPLVSVAVCALMAAASLAACMVPARRASRTDPATALREG